jgi:hypothetical protein
MLIAGGVGTVVFTSSAIVGYTRTADCRAAEENTPHPQHASSGARQGETFTSSLVPASGCSGRGDAPLVCSWGTSGASELAMGGVER